MLQSVKLLLSGAELTILKPLHPMLELNGTGSAWQTVGAAFPTPRGRLEINNAVGIE